MIYPTRAAVWVTAAGAPLALAIAVLRPAGWIAGLVWPAAVLLLSCLDALLAPRPGAGRLRLVLPGGICVGADAEIGVRIAIGGRAPRRAEVALDIGPLLRSTDEGRLWARLSGGRGAATLAVTALRRGTARIARSWLRWKGPVGLVWVARVEQLAAEIPILPDVRPVHERGAQVFERFALQGLVAQAGREEGTEFEALVEYRPGMDRRAIDWKQSARHHKLHAKEYRPERNALMVLAVDAGRLMCEPVAGVPRVDRMVSAALLTAWIALKLGDRVSVFAYDARPRLASGAVAGTRAFTQVQRIAAQIDYSGEETNHTLALTTLGGRLERRALVVLFTEITDLTAADLLVRAAARLAETHLLLLVVLEDEELEQAASARPEEADDVARAVTAAALLRERRIVLTRLRHLGIHVVESPYHAVVDRLVAAYLDIKRRSLV